MLKISITARKGGQARSTTAFHLAGAFARLNKRVLILDVDPQPTVSKCLLSAQVVDTLPAHRTIAAVYNDNAFPTADQVVHATEFEAIRLVPGSDHVTPYDYPTPEDHPGWCEAIRAFLPEIEPLADVMIMDTAPNAALLTFSTLVAADVAVTPVVCEVNAVQEIHYVRRLTERVRQHFNPSLRWLGMFPSAFAKRLAVHRTYYDALAQAFGELFIPVPIPESSVVKEAAVARKPLPLWKPKVAVSKAIMELAEAILARASATQESRKEAA